MLVIDEPLVQALLREQFPDLAGERVAPVVPGGWDNRMFRVGEALVARLPSAPGYEPQVAKEHAWLPVLAPTLGVAVPAPLRRGRPGCGYPFEWSLYSWVEGETLLQAPRLDLTGLARDVAEFVCRLQAVPTAGGPAPGLHSGYRGGPVARWDSETRAGLAVCAPLLSAVGLDPDRLQDLWSQATAAPPCSAPVWFHGDLAPGNLLVRDGRLSAVIDFGCAGVGDPACDLAFAWTTLAGTSRSLFRDLLDVDDDTWSRGRGWALWKAVIQLRGEVEDDARRGPVQRRVHGGAAAPQQLPAAAVEHLEVLRAISAGP